MTVLVFRDGVLASDDGAVSTYVKYGSVRKVARGADNALYGVTGDAGACSDFLRWVDGWYVGEMPRPVSREEGRSSFMVLVFDADGHLGLLSAGGTEDLTRVPYIAFGAGQDVAMGALFMGATAQEAVAAAIEHASGVHGSVQFVERSHA